MTKRIALIAGITGRDGAYRCASSTNFRRLAKLGLKNHRNFDPLELDLTDQGSGIRVVQRYKADESYNLAAQSFVGVPFDQHACCENRSGLEKPCGI